ncbi:phosphotransferase, partial [Aeromonas jandaei]|uniref:phosphotransferase n=1 Tax=Aeromonas jandaei TaxID=650 RepID=UPI0038B5D6ED
GEPERFGDHRETIGYELVDTLAAIHEIDPEKVGLGEFGRPAGYTDRQVGLWERQIEWAMEVTTDEREIPTLQR